MFCADGCFYVVKFQNNPQGTRVLANELLVSQLANRLGLPVSPVAIVQVEEALLRVSPDLSFELQSGRAPCQPGLHFGSRHLGKVLDLMPRSMLSRVQNRAAFAGAVVLDKWTGNIDPRQAIFRKSRADSPYQAFFIDHGLCFGGRDWRFANSPAHGTYAELAVYEEITSWESFEPWLTRAESMDEGEIWRCAADVPEEWYEKNSADLGQLVERLSRRRSQVRKLIAALRDSSLRPFPNWTSSPEQVVVAAGMPELCLS